MLAGYAVVRLCLLVMQRMCGMRGGPAFLPGGHGHVWDMRGLKNVIAFIASLHILILCPGTHTHTHHIHGRTNTEDYVQDRSHAQGQEQLVSFSDSVPSCQEKQQQR